MIILTRDSLDGAYPHNFFADKDPSMKERLNSSNEFSLENFSIVLDYLYYSDPTQDIRLLGGEPTKHSKFEDILQLILEKGFKKIIIFSNGDLDEEAIVVVRKYISHLSFVWNINPRGLYDDSTNTRIHESIRAFSTKESSFRFNIHTTDYDTAFILDFLKENPIIQTIHIGISRPMGSGNLEEKQKTAIYIKDYPRVGTIIYDFVKTIVSNNQYSHIGSVGLDCGYTPCLWTDEQLDFLRKTLIFTYGGCSPDLTTVYPDLSVRQCLMKVTDKEAFRLTDFQHINEVREYNSRRFALSDRFLPIASLSCEKCIDRESCFGGCGGERVLQAKLRLAKVEFCLKQKNIGTRKKAELLYEAGTIAITCYDYDKALYYLKAAKKASISCLNLFRYFQANSLITTVEQIQNISIHKDYRMTLTKIKESFLKDSGKALFSKKNLSTYTATLINIYFDWKFSVRNGFTGRMAEVRKSSDIVWKNKEVSEYIKNTEWVKYNIDDPWIFFGYTVLLRIYEGDGATGQYIDEYFKKDPLLKEKTRDIIENLKPDGIIGDIIIDIMKEKFVNTEISV